MTSRQFVLTDVDNGIWTDRFSVSESDGLTLRGATGWSVSKRTLRGGVSDGVDVVELNNGTLNVAVLPTRGMGLWKACCGDLELGWESPVRRPVHPSFVDLSERGGLGWLAGFNELLCRCGLASNGPPGTDVIVDANGGRSETPLTLHGKIANIPAHYVAVDVSTEGDGTLSIVGVVDEVMMFGSCLRLKSTLQTAAGSNSLTITDEVTNLSGQPAELELLYHTNVGWPILGPGSRFAAPIREVAPRDTAAVAGADSFELYSGPTLGYREQVYFMDLVADENDETVVLLRNAAGDKGVSLQFDRNQLPYFTLWKNTPAAADGYVTGLEPATNFPNFKTYERQQGRIVNLEAGDTYVVRLKLSVPTSAADVAAIERRIHELAAGVPRVVHATPRTGFSPA